MATLVTGGAGYIGSHAVQKLCAIGKHVVVVDDLTSGHRQAVDPDAIFFECSLQETKRLVEIFDQQSVNEVLHFAGCIEVSESTRDPLKFYRNNVAGSLSLLAAMQKANVRRLIFSSTCAVYGAANSAPITEDAPEAPTNAYARSKLMVEHVLRDLVASAPEWSVAILRYFNVAGCAENGLLGEDHRPETHLIPLVLQTALGQRNVIEVYGSDYGTRDGTCIRDYVHVDDLVHAHLIALEKLTPGETHCLNVGMECGFTVYEVISSAQRVTGIEIPWKICPRRSGDVASLTANSSAIREKYGWSPRFTDLDAIIETAWNWMQRNPHGYPDL